MYHRGLLVAIAFAVVGQCFADVDSNVVESERSSGVLSGFKSFFSIYNECSGQEITSCLKLKLVTAMDRAMRSYNGDLNVIDGVTFVRDASVPVSEEPAKTEAELEAILPRSLADKENSLDGLIMEKILSFFQSHTIQFKFPAAADMKRSLTEEGRKKNKGMGLLLLPLMMAGMLIPIALGGLALLAGKALIVSKLALVLAGIIGLKKLLGGGGHHESTQHIVASHGHGHGGHGSYGRSMDGSDLAYRSYVAQRAATA